MIAADPRMDRCTCCVAARISDDGKVRGISRKKRKGIRPLPRRKAREDICACWRGRRFMQRNLGNGHNTLIRARAVDARALRTIRIRRAIYGAGIAARIVIYLVTIVALFHRFVAHAATDVRTAYTAGAADTATGGTARGHTQARLTRCTVAACIVIQTLLQFGRIPPGTARAVPFTNGIVVARYFRCKGAMLR